MTRFKSIIVTMVATVCMAASMRQPEVNYEHKSLFKELKRGGIEATDVLEEVATSPKDSGTFNGKFFRITTQNDHHFQYVYVGRVNSCRAGGCGAPSTASNYNSEYFDYFIIYDQKKSVKVVRVFNYQATHGHEVSARGWLKQFVGYDGSGQLEVNKNVDAISGATVSVFAITEDVTSKTAILNRIDI